MDKAIADARKTGISEQAILEARFLYHVDRREDEAIAAMLPEFLKQREAFKLEDSAIFGVKEDWLAVIEYVQAIDALGKGDTGCFQKTHHRSILAQPAAGRRLRSAHRTHAPRGIHARRENRFQHQACCRSLQTRPVTLAKLIAGKKALLFHFWSPLSRECEAAMPDFVATAALLSSNGIAVASLLPDDIPGNFSRRHAP